MTPQHVAVLGASPKEDRYSNQAVRQLLDQGHHVYPVHPTCAEIHGQPCYKRLDAIARDIDTLTLYVGEAHSTQMLDHILALKPKRIIMNPGAENDTLEANAKAQGIDVIRGCTLIMLQIGQF